MSKTTADQIQDLEDNIARCQDAAKRLFNTGEGTKKRFLDVDELKALSLVANAESRAHAELWAIRRQSKEAPVDEAELVKRAIAMLEAKGYAITRPKSA